MKRRIVALAPLLLVFCLLAGCSSSADPTPYSALGGSTYFTVDPGAHTVSDGTYTYVYKTDGNGLEITYPGGEVFQYRTTNSGNGFSSATGSWRGGLGPKGNYAKAWDLAEALAQQTPTQSDGQGHPLLALLFVALGVWYAVAPYSAWYVAYGWRYKNAEPSDAALPVCRCSGVVAIILGVFVFFI